MASSATLRDLGVFFQFYFKLGFVWEETPGKTQDTLKTLCLLAGLRTPRGPLRRAGGSGRGQGRLGISAQAAAPATRSPGERQMMDGWMDGQSAGFCDKQALKAYSHE